MATISYINLMVDWWNIAVPAGTMFELIASCLPGQETPPARSPAGLFDGWGDAARSLAWAKYVESGAS
ncbi:hypothetical protein [Sphingomonas sp.]|uniref:hypothetical protein n=1 Tax=Sphingomonas sp. TaxID=28214 RepID=UPI003D6CF95A